MKKISKIISFVIYILLSHKISYTQIKIEKWGIFELSLHSKEIGNPFIGTRFYATFKNGKEIFQPEGFYDGNGIYKIRFMPDKEGIWTYETHSNRDTLNGIKGYFMCVSPSRNNHGPVYVKDKFHFSFADGTRFIPFGTTIYQWCFQSDSLRNLTIQTLANSPFNKVRFLIIPPFSERYLYGPNKLTDFPFEGNPKKSWDFSKFDVNYFNRIDSCIKLLMDIGVQADIIIFNPYCKEWGFDNMDQETNRRFVRYVVDRYAAFRNVWWSLANENSFLQNFTDKDWDNLFNLIAQIDPYHHLRSVHNADKIYNYTMPWVTHVSLQYYNAAKVFGIVPLLRDIYKKPIILDEINYEGDINRRWGQLTGEEMTYRFWVTYIGGGYATHGETFKKNGWTSSGGVLIGSSPSRINFLKKILENSPTIDPIDQYYVMNIAGKPGEYYLIYFGKEKLNYWRFELPKNGLEDGMKFKVDIIDTWNMKIIPVKEIFEVKKKDIYTFVDKNNKKVYLPNKPYIALRIKRI